MCFAHIEKYMITFQEIFMWTMRKKGIQKALVKVIISLHKSELMKVGTQVSEYKYVFQANQSLGNKKKTPEHISSLH